ncbi:MAG TPA: ATP-binding protein [Hyphomicrobiaceae bacterium]|jgi:signal transduction histidine kinase
MIRLGFTARLIAIFATSLVALQLLAVVAYVMQRSRATEGSLRLPLPDQAAALVELLETMPKEQWPTLLRAANSTDLSVRILDVPPDDREPEWYEAPVVEFILRRYLSVLGDREVRVRVEPSSEELVGPLKALAWVSPGAVEIEVRLKTGETLIVSAGGMLSLSVLGLPPGFWAGVLGLGVAALALFLLRREARPLRELAAAVDQAPVGEDAHVIPDAPRSAPEIRALIGAFNRLTERIASLLRSRMALVGGISHDLRTYVTRLRLRIDLIPDGTEKEKAIRDLDDMTQLLDDALTAFKAGSVAREEELVDLADILVREAEDRRLAGACVTLDLPEPVRAAQVLGDALALRRCVSNLIDNAIQYGLEARVSAVLRNQRVVVMIDDRGPGIRTEDRDTVMEPFVRLETSRNRRTGGAGLGLAIARGVAEAHGGHLTLGDAPGGGTRAIIELPVFQD